MIKSVRFKFGPTPDAAPIEITPGPMTVIVGPNNSGKSLTLRELNDSLSEAASDWQDERWQILADIEPGLPPAGELRERVLKVVAGNLSLIRASHDDDPVYKILAMLLGRSEMAPELLQSTVSWLAVLNRNWILTDNLVEQKKLRLLPPTPGPPNSSAIEAAIQSGWVGLADYLPAQRRAILELIYAINERNDEALITEGFIDLRGYYKLYTNQTLLLDGKARLALGSDERSGSLRARPTGTIMRLWHARPDLERLRAHVLDAFGVHLCIDITDLGRASLVLSDQAPPPGIEDRLDAEARAFIATTRPLDDFSDGVRTYIGLHAELIAQDRRFVMIDEPEAFLHPPLARRLGFNLSTLAAERGSSVFAATHSPDFLMGCIESGVDINIVRLGYRNGVASAHLLPQDELKAMMVDPLLRSTGILGALFHQAAVVVEGDSDRTFYNEVTERLRIYEPSTHPAVMRDCMFINAQGKATVSRILAALHRLGVASCGIVDLDLLKDPGICKNLFEAAGAPESVCNSIVYTRSQIASSIGSKLADLCKANGLDHASPADRQSVQHFIREMAAYGIFLPEVGRVEGWLSQLGVKAHKSVWIPAIFEKMGPVNTGLKPASGDVWEFIRRIGRHLETQGAPHLPT
jgi:energy-coupling factor transporter ATP-binding protein EcfA2